MINKRDNPHFRQLLYKTKIEVAKLILSHVKPFKQTSLNLCSFSKAFKLGNDYGVSDFIATICLGMLSSECMSFMLAHNNKTPYDYLINIYHNVLSYNRNIFLTKYKHSKLYQDYKTILSNYDLSIDNHIKNCPDAFFTELTAIKSFRDIGYMLYRLYENCAPISTIVQFYEDITNQKELTEK